MNIEMRWPWFYSRKKKKLIQKAIEFSVKYFNLTVDIELRVKRFTFRSVGGWCRPFPSVNGLRACEVVVIDQMSMTDILLIVFHEMTHVAQFKSGDLSTRTNRDPIAVFQGKIYPVFQMSYWDYPWEREAYATQGKMLDAFLEANVLTAEERDCIESQPQSEISKRSVRQALNRPSFSLDNGFGSL